MGTSGQSANGNSYAIKKVRFPDWQHTSQGERLVQKELRRTLLKYKLHTDQDLFDKAYGYIRQYY
jgi:type I restriction enzyme, R subunit